MKDFSSVSDLLTKTKDDKSLFIDYLFEYHNVGAHCLNGIVDEKIKEYSAWSGAYKHVFALSILSLIQKKTKDADSIEVNMFIKEFSREFDSQIRKELKKLKKAKKDEYNDIFPLVNKNLNPVVDNEDKKVKIPSKETARPDKKKEGKKKKDEEEDEDEHDESWHIVGEMYMDGKYLGKEYFYLYLPRFQEPEKLKLPFSGKRSAWWETQKDYLQSAVNLELKVYKERNVYEKGQFGISKIDVNSFNKQLYVGKDFFAMLASPGKPILKLEVGLDLDISADGVCEARNPQWKYEKKWPEDGYEPKFIDY